MNLLDNLRQVSDYSSVKSLREVLAQILPLEALEEPEIQNFLDESIILSLSCNSEDEFIRSIKNNIG